MKVPINLEGRIVVDGLTAPEAMRAGYTKKRVRDPYCKGMTNIVWEKPATAPRVPRAKFSPGLVYLTTFIATGLVAFCVIRVTSALTEQTDAAKAAQASAARSQSLVERMARDFKACETPAKTGDRLVVVMLNDGGRLVTSCRMVTNWQEPERATP